MNPYPLSQQAFKHEEEHFFFTILCENMEPSFFRYSKKHFDFGVCLHKSILFTADLIFFYYILQGYLQ